ncbi:methylthioadenosine phosphorylase [Anaeromyxobacter sp. K]|uniref:S-methyl-5'-thioadenosine phosphorylase n=1 Tax=Anaeromyxobacter dehalogenans (strain ATCC BAA-258 / DSM 21875 / 2CP-1) TaxID=455488 RepID=B8JE58_ANAD2|nr:MULTISPECIES: S-methyl-5'-thioadenosine phosphorylase [Anaeromyxobacter]ACG73916.1 methylthioadenosine phosphorylase [Anaeromyxobacter sp. K]ACL66123.1 methylthioadenosine phosphorylase [Anaeromyxobacter dehalogenans 2CP-1]
MARAMVGVIGGTGLGEALGALGGGEVRALDTPFGRPSAPITLTEVGGVPVALLPRHGEGHMLNPSQVPYRANIWALKSLGVTHVLASGAVGSLREEVAPRNLVIPDQVIDKTFRRAGTFFDDLAVHVEFAAPFCTTLRNVLVKAGTGFPARVHQGGTYVCMEGPQFSTRAESELHRSWGASLIGMTVMPEAKLAREAELCYALVALPTDYDCWKPHPASVDQAKLIEEILANVKSATQNAIELIRRAIPHVAALEKPCACQSALALAIWSDRSRIAPATREKLRPILEKYLAG